MMDYVVDNVAYGTCIDANIIRGLLVHYDDKINNMSKISADRLVDYLIKELKPPCKSVGIYYAQQLVHGITQSSLSGKTDSHNSIYLPITEVLEMRSTNSVCFIHSSYDDAIKLDQLLMRDLIKSVDRSICPKWVMSHSTDIMYNIEDYIDVSGGTKIALKKDIMARYSVTMDVIKCAISRTSQYSKELNFSSNALAEIYIDDYYKASVLTILSSIDDILVSGIKGLKISVTSNGYCCDAKFYDILRSRKDIDVTCNDILAVYTSDGHNKCRELIINSLTSNQDISSRCATVICDYMMSSGKPKPFTKASIKGLYGPMFDMYFGTPVPTIVNWILSGEEDLCMSPYTKMMIGNKVTSLSN